MRDLRPRHIGAVLDDALDLYRANFKAIALASLMLVAPVALIVGLGQSFYLRGTFEALGALEDPISGPVSPGLTLAYAATMIGSMATFLAVSYLASCILASAPALLAGERIDHRALLKSGFQRYGWYLLTSMVVGFVVQVATIISLPILFTGGLIAWAAFALAAVVTVVERVPLADALTRSRLLTKGYRFRVLAYLVLVWALVTAFEGAIASPLIIRQIVVVAQNPEALFVRVPVGWKILEGCTLALSSALTAPYWPLALFSLYVDLRARKEGMDIIMRAREFASRP